MTQALTGEVTCDRCYTSEEFALPGFSQGTAELTSFAERRGWSCDGEDVCPDCVAEDVEWEEDAPEELSGNLQHVNV